MPNLSSRKTQLKPLHRLTGFDIKLVFNFSTKQKLLKLQISMKFAKACIFIKRFLGDRFNTNFLYQKIFFGRTKVHSVDGVFICRLKVLFERKILHSVVGVFSFS